MSKLQNRTDAENAAQRILSALGKTLVAKNKLIHIGASIGSFYENDSHTKGEELIKDADLAMYTAKKKGKCQYSIA
tara:strand:+ start:438 stop:665 length:228 start_codon:yes stop_codon:yes gene_type:complete